MTKLHDKEYFYKYTTAEVVKNILNDLQVKCCSPLLFNDPFDSQIEIQHDVENNEELIKRSTGKICELIKPFLKDCKVEQAHELVVADMMANPQFVNDRKDAFERFYSEVNEKIFEFVKKDRIFCVSEINGNLLMWAHYANDHQGAVIQFKCLPEEDSALCVAKPVVYSEEMPLLAIEDLSNGEEAIKNYILNGILLTKSKDWEHEHEWRVILMRQSTYHDYDLRSISEDEIHAIYLGYRMSQKDKSEIINIVKTRRKNTKIYESFKNCKEFKLDFKELV